jgi:hypothetical protein
VNDAAYFRSLLSRPWEPGRDGKGLVLVDGRLRTWVADAAGNVHHFPAMELLGLGEAEVVAYLSIRADGTVTVWTTSASDAEPRALAALAADERLLARDDEDWHFA